MKSKLETERYQDLYLKAWKAQNEIDVQRNPLMAPNPAFYMLEHHRKMVAEKKKEVDERTKIINALNAGKKIVEIAVMVGKSERTVGRRIYEIRHGHEQKK